MTVLCDLYDYFVTQDSVDMVSHLLAIKRLRETLIYDKIGKLITNASSHG